MVPDVQTLCLQSSIRSTPKQLHQCLYLYSMHFRITILWFHSRCHLIIYLNPYFRGLFCHINWLWKYVTEMPSFHRLLETTVLLLPLLFLSFLSTPLDFNHRYSRGSANEHGSPRVHPKVTHLKPIPPEGKLPHHYAYFDTTLTNIVIIVGMFWIRCCVEIHVLHCVFQFVSCSKLRWRVEVNERLMITERQHQLRR